MKSWVALVAVGLLAGCGGSTSSDGNGQGQTGGDTSAPPAPTTPGDTGSGAQPRPDHGQPSDTYPAFAPEVGQLVDNGGDILAAPEITTITWAGEPNAATFEQFGDELGPSAYWKAVTSEYGVGAAKSDAEHHVRLADAAPATIADTDIPTLLTQHLTDTATTWPVPNDNSVYIFYIPQASTLTLEGDGACAQGIGGYHDSTNINGKQVAYAVVPQCDSDVGEVTLSASHELAEASTDPHPQDAPAWVGFDENHLSWEFFQQFQSEDGDACEFYRASTMTDADIPFTVQRQWSNASAKAGHDPCVPAPVGTYFNVTPLTLDTIDLDLSALGGGTAPTKGYKVKVGETKTIALGFYSDGPIEPWTIRAVEGGIMGTSQKGRVDLSLDVTQGTNGQKAYLTVKVNTQGRTKGELISIVSDNGKSKHYMPIMIGSPDK